MESDPVETLEPSATTAHTEALPSSRPLPACQHATSDAPTLATMVRRRSGIPGLAIKINRKLLLIILTGSLRARDRLKAAKLVEDDVCQHDGDRDTTHHIFCTF